MTLRRLHCENQIPDENSNANNPNNTATKRLIISIFFFFVLFGSLVSNVSNDITKRILLASIAFGKLKKKLSQTEKISYAYKLRLCNELIIPIVTFDSEIWMLKAGSVFITFPWKGDSSLVINDMN